MQKKYGYGVETRTVREETNLTYDGNGNILTEAVTEAYSGSTTRTRTYQYDQVNRLISAMSPRTLAELRTYVMDKNWIIESWGITFQQEEAEP